MSSKSRETLPATAFTLPADFYTTDAVYDKERARFFRPMWTYVGRLDDLPVPGAYLTREIAGDNVIVVRQADETVRAFLNICRHRGTRLCTESHGRFGGTIQCPYHAWTYDYRGDLVGAPHMDGSPGFRPEEFSLGAVRADTWAGFVFVSLVSDGPTLREHLASLTGTFENWHMHTLVRADRLEYDVAANWKLLIQNYNECLHCPTLHPHLNKLSHYLGGENEPLQPTYLGGRMDLNDGVETMSMDGSSPRAPLPDLSESEKRCVYYYSVLPNFLIAPHPDYVMVHTLWPQAPGRTRIECEWLVHPEEHAKPDFDFSDAREFWDLTNRQDWHVCEQAQAGISSPGYRPGPYSNREDLLYAFDRFIVKTLADA